MCVHAAGNCAAICGPGPLRLPSWAATAMAAEKGGDADSNVRVLTAWQLLRHTPHTRPTLTQQPPIVMLGRGGAEGGRAEGARAACPPLNSPGTCHAVASLPVTTPCLGLSSGVSQARPQRLDRGSRPRRVVLLQGAGLLHTVCLVTQQGGGAQGGSGGAGQGLRPGRLRGSSGSGGLTPRPRLTRASSCRSRELASGGRRRVGEATVPGLCSKWLLVRWRDADRRHSPCPPPPSLLHDVLLQPP